MKLQVIACLLMLLHTSCVQSFDVNGARRAAAKKAFLASLEASPRLNAATAARSELVQELARWNPTTAPGSTESFSPVAVGTWRVIYAPHISTFNQIAQGCFDPVLYNLQPRNMITSHARYEFPIIGKGWLSVSGTYGSQDEDRVCRVDFNRAWIKILDDDTDDLPYPDIDSVPSGWAKNLIDALGRFFFIDSVSVFPVSYLDQDTIVFDFELLGTRICARKVQDTETGTPE